MFRLGAPPDPTFMPLFAELVRIDRIVRRPAGDLARASRDLLARHLARRPVSNPVRRFAERFAGDLVDAQGRGLEFYHQWAFATTRQLGAASELTALCLEWLDETLGQPPLAAAAPPFQQISAHCKTLILKAARAVNARRALDADALFLDMAVAWERGIAAIQDGLRR